MTLTKPTIEVATIRLVAIDTASGKSKSTTIYQSSPAEVITKIESLLASDGVAGSDHSHQPDAAA